MKRWTKTASVGDPLHYSGNQLPMHSTEAKRRMLVMKALDLANCTEINDSSFLAALQALDAAKGSPCPAPASVTSRPNASATSVPLRCPQRPAKRGRRVGTSLRSWKSSNAKRRKAQHAVLPQPEVMTDGEENPIGGKTRPVDDLFRA